MAWVFLVSLGLLAYVFLGYPWLLRAIVRRRGARPVRKAAVEPTVTLIVSAFNEAAVIGKKIENGLALDYPAGKLTIAVVSDASDDGTDDIVRSYAGRGVRLFRQEERRGKTAGLNAVVPRLTSEVVVFSDANAMYEPGAVRALVQNFADPDVGCVTGEARYLKEGATAADEGERTYWNYEIQIKRLETAVGSVVGGDGAIYAIRRELWRNLPENAINDFLNPLQIVAAGWRGVYEPDAVCWEETAGGTGREYRRRVRIVSRSWRAVFQAPGVLNPFRVGFFSVSIVSHKMLRWLSGVLALLMAGSGAVWLTWHPGIFGWPLFLSLAVAAMLLVILPAGRRLLRLAAYFAVINVASAVGLFKGSFGDVSGTWTPPRQVQTAGSSYGAVWKGLSIVGLFTVSLTLLFVTVRDDYGLDAALFWTSVATLVYIYAVYPVIMLAWKWIAPRPTEVAPVTPSICLFITAHNEATVIAEKVLNSLALDYPRDLLQIVVASDGSTDGTNEIVQSFEADGVRLAAFPERKGKISAINRGVPLVSSDVVVFSDANTFLEPDALRAMACRFADAKVGAVSGDVVLVGERADLAQPEDLYYKYERWLQALESTMGSMIGADGALYGIRRELFAPPAGDTILDDMFIPIAVARQGFRVVFEPNALAFEQGSLTALEEFFRKSRVVAGAVQLLFRSGRLIPWDNPQFVFSFFSHKVLRWLSPWFAVTALVTSVSLAQTAVTYVALSVGLVFFVLLGAAGSLPRLRRAMPVALAHYFWLVQVAALLGLVRGLARRQPATWRRFARGPARPGHPVAKPGGVR